MYTIHNAFHDIVMVVEKFYSNNKNDWGGETLFGISRVKNPTFKGFEILDDIKNELINSGIPNDELTKKISNSYYESVYQQRISLIENYAISFYENMYWNRLRCSLMPYEQFTKKLFEIGINCGVHKASSILQHAMNLLNYNGGKWGEVVEDGEIGPQTLSTLKTIETVGLIPDLVELIKYLQAEHYIEIARKHPTQETNLLGWLRRVRLF